VFSSFVASRNLSNFSFCWRQGYVEAISFGFSAFKAASRISTKA